VSFLLRALLFGNERVQGLKASVEGGLLLDVAGRVFVRELRPIGLAALQPCGENGVGGLGEGNRDLLQLREPLAFGFAACAAWRSLRASG
jgi:hypothetical protein